MASRSVRAMTSASKRGRPAGVGEDEGCNEVRTFGSQQQRRLPAERLSDDDRLAEAQRLDGEGAIADVSRARHVGGPPLAAAVPPRVERDDPAAPGEPPRRRGPFARVAGQTVQQQRRRPRAAEVEPRQADAVALQEHGTNRQRGSVH